MSHTFVRLAAVWMAGLTALAAATSEPPPGGINAAPPVAPALHSLPWAELACGPGSVRVPSGSWSGTSDGGKLLPAPIGAFRLGSGAWCGAGYIETYARCVSFTAAVTQVAAELTYRFDDGATWTARLAVVGNRLRIDEQSTLGPRDRWVFDAAPGWSPAAGAIFTAAAAKCRFLTLPCHYDRMEGLVLPSGAAAGFAGLAVIGVDRPEMLLFSVDPGDGPGVELWQHRQLGAETGSRQSLGPDTKSDGVNDPRTADLVGPSLWSGHVTVEFRLMSGKRTSWLSIAAKPAERADLPAAIAQAVGAKP